MQQMLKAKTLIANRYEVVDKIGGGGMSIIYKVFDQRLGKHWAMKEMWLGRFEIADQPKMIEIFEREAKILASLRHPGIPIIVDYFVEGNNYYIIMDLIDGEDLDKILNRKTQLDVNGTINLGIDIAKIIEYLHSQQPAVLYRDLKPSNVMIAKPEKVILTDFGIANWQKTFQPGQTKKDTIPFGTPGYTSPEQFSGKTDERSDIYSLGATLHHLLSGVNPELKPFQFEPLRMLRPEIPEKLEEIINKAVQATASQRFQTITEMKQALQDLMKPQVSSVVSASAPSEFTPDLEIVNMFINIGIIYHMDGNNPDPRNYQIENNNLFAKIINYYKSGLIYQALKTTQILIKRLEKSSLSCCPDCTMKEKGVLDEFYLILAKLYEVKGNLKAAQKNYQKSIQHDPTHHLAFNDLARVNTTIENKKQQRWQNLLQRIGGWKDFKSFWKKPILPFCLLIGWILSSYLYHCEFVTPLYLQDILITIQLLLIATVWFWANRKWDKINTVNATTEAKWFTRLLIIIFFVFVFASGRGHHHLYSIVQYGPRAKVILEAKKSGKPIPLLKLTPTPSPTLTPPQTPVKTLSGKGIDERNIEAKKLIPTPAKTNYDDYAVDKPPKSQSIPDPKKLYPKPTPSPIKTSYEKQIETKTNMPDPENKIWGIEARKKLEIYKFKMKLKELEREKIKLMQEKK